MYLLIISIIVVIVTNCCASRLCTYCTYTLLLQ